MTPKEVRTQWVAALRSGHYKQGRHRLHLGDTFCPLGVLCELAVAAAVTTVSYEKTDNGSLQGCYSKWRHTTMLPVEVMVWAGLRTDCGDYDHTSLILNNDQDCLSFDAIAAIIEADRDHLSFDAIATIINNDRDYLSFDALTTIINAEPPRPMQTRGKPD